MSLKHGLLLAALALAAGFGLAGAARSAGDGKASRRSAYANEFPGGEGKPLADRYCQICHSATLATQQAKDSTGWEKTVTLMEKWGARLVPEDHATVVAYLLRSYGPAKK